MKIIELYKMWCKETNRSGGILLGSSIREFFTWLENHYILIKKKMKTSKEFNEKYKDFLEEGYYGLSFDNEEFITWLDGKFQEFIKKPGFKYSQIKVKFGTGRFYCKGLSIEQVMEIEHKITELCKN